MSPRRVARHIALSFVAALAFACEVAPDSFARPTGVAFDRRGNVLVADGYDHARVARFSADGEFVASWGERGVGPGQLDTPHGIAIDGHDRVIVADRENARVQVFDADGRVLAVWDDPIFGRPWAVAIDSENHVFILDGGDQDPDAPRTRVIETNSDGRVLRVFDTRTAAEPAIDTGHSIAVAPDGAIYVADLEGSRVVKLIRE